jgi:DNA-binding CsgD family transcriptional regulator
MTLSPAATHQVAQLTEGRFYLTSNDRDVFFVSALTGDKVVLLQSDDGPSEPARETETEPGASNRFAAVSSLSDRELQVLTMLGDGIEMQEIADRLGVSVKTVETYRARIKQKLLIKGRLPLIAFAIEWKLQGRRNQAEGDGRPRPGARIHQPDGQARVNPVKSSN